MTNEHAAALALALSGGSLDDRVTTINVITITANAGESAILTRMTERHRVTAFGANSLVEMVDVDRYSGDDFGIQCGLD